MLDAGLTHARPMHKGQGFEDNTIAPDNQRKDRPCVARSLYLEDARSRCIARKVKFGDAFQGLSICKKDNPGTRARHP
jgi:hypothetical protein